MQVTCRMVLTIDQQETQKPENVLYKPKANVRNGMPCLSPELRNKADQNALFLPVGPQICVRTTGSVVIDCHNARKAIKRAN